jgi:hypothetical protein
VPTTVRDLRVGHERGQAGAHVGRELGPVEEQEAVLRRQDGRHRGARGDWAHAHYGRFLRIWQEYHELRKRDPSFEPSRPVLPAYTRQPFDVSAPLPVITDPLTHRLAELTALAYELVLQLLTRYFTHTDETDERLGVLIDAAIGLMSGVLRPLATGLTTLPVGEAHPGRTAGFTFQMYYPMGNFGPWREPAWALLLERISPLVERCTAATQAVGAGGAVQQALRQAMAITATIGAHVPAEFRPR